MEILIHKASFDHVEAILKIVNDSIATTTSNYNYEPQTIANQIAWFNNKMEQNFPIFVAMLENEVVGFASYGTFREKIGYRFTVEHSVYVESDFQGKGIGKLLLQKLIETAKVQQLHIMIGCIDEANQASIDFHKKFGFTIAGTIAEAAYKFDKWLNLVIMQLKLT